MKQSFTQKCGLALLLMLFAFVQGSWAQGNQKIDPILTFTPQQDVYTAEAGANRFERPTLSVEDNSTGQGKIVRSRFKLTWTIVDKDGNTPAETSDDEGKRIYKDPNTNTSVQKVYGVVKIGDKVGTVKIRVTATPMSKYAGIYNSAIKEYTIQVTAPTINYEVYEGDQTITTEGTANSPLNVYTYLDKSQNKYTSMTCPLPTINIWHLSNNIKVNDNDKYNVSYAFAEGDKFNVEGTNFTAKVDGLPGTTSNTGTLTITATPKSGYDTNIYKTLTYSVSVKSNYLDGTKKLKTYISFERNGKPQNVISHYRAYRINNQTYYVYTAPEQMPSVVIKDENGNDVTNAYVLSYGSMKDGKFVDHKVYGQDVIHTYSNDPLDSYGNWYYYKDEANVSWISVTDNTPKALYQLSGIDGARMAGYQPDDYIVTVKAYVKKPNDQRLHDIGWWNDNGKVPDYSGIYEAEPEPTGKVYDEDGTLDETGVKGMLYDTNNKNIYTDIQSNQLVFHLMKRAAEIKFTPDPSEVTLANMVDMTPTNRFNVVGLLEDKTVEGTGIDSLLYEGTYANKFQYCVFIPNENKYDGTEPTDKVTVEFLSGWSQVDENAEQLIDVIGTDGKPTGETKVVPGTRYYSKLNWNNDDLHMRFHGKGYIPLYYTLIPYTPQNWDISQSKAFTFHIEDAEPTKLVVDPKTIYAAINEQSIPPTFKVMDQFGKVDLTDQFKFHIEYADGEGDGHYGYQLTSKYYKNDDPSQGIDSNFGSFKPSKQGTVKINVTAELISTDNTKYLAPTNTESYEVITKEDWAATEPTYEIIYDGSEFDAKTGLNDDNAKTKMGKLHFIKAGEMYPGKQVYQEVPGINLTFGSAEEADKYEVTSTQFSTADNPKLEDNSNDLDGTNGKRCLINIPNATFSADAEDDDIVVTGGYIRIDALTNGWLTIDGDFSCPSDATDSKYITLRNISSGRAQDYIINKGENKKGEYTYPLALLAGQSYALYCVDGMQIHGIDFDPAFISDYRDHAAWHTAVSFQNGYTGNLPKLSNGKQNTVTYYVRDVASEGGTISKIDNGVGFHAEVNTSTGAINSKKLTSDGTLTTDKNAEMDNRVSIVASVKGKDRTSEGNGLGQVEKRPHYNLFIGDMPTYIVGDGEQLDQGNRLSTTNIPTRIWMTIGGWEHGMSAQDNYPYYRNNDKNNNALADSWALAKMDSTGRDNMTIDNFNYQVSGSQNPADENVGSWTSGKKNTFCVPVRGTYLKFEPEESGRLFVYVLQNGMSDLAYTDKTKLQTAQSEQEGNVPDGVKNDQSYRLRRRAMYIIDETGKNVDIADGNEDWGTGMDKYLPDATTVKSRFPGYEYPNKNYYTDGILRIGWNYDATIGGTHSLTFCKSGDSPETSGDFRNYEKDRSAVETWWTSKVKYNGKEQDRLNGPLEVLKLQDGGFAIPTKAYVRYTFNVKAGKTYYMFVSGSKLGFCGFGFLPAGYTEKADAWVNKMTGDKSEDERSFDRKTVLDKLPEPNSSEYENTAKENIGAYDLTADIVLDAQKFAANDGSYAKLDNTIKTKQFVNVKLKRTFLNQRWSGICLPFAVSEYQLQQIFGENSSVITFDSIRADRNGVNPETGATEDHSRTIHFTRHVAQTIEAGRPYFIYPNVEGVAAGKPIGTLDGSDSRYYLTFKHVSFENKDTMNVVGFNEDVINHNKTAAVDDSIKIFTYKACGIYDACAVPQYSYYLKTSENESENAFNRLTSDKEDNRWLLGYNTYLYPYSDDPEGKDLVNTTTTSKAKMASFWITGAEVNGGSTTGIDELNGLVNNINVEQTTFVNGVYTVDGRKVSSKNSLKGLAPGVYIMGGKKYTVK